MAWPLITGVTGNPHSGKTLFLTLAAIDALDHGMQVFANYHITYKRGKRMAQFIDLGKLALWVQKGNTLRYDSAVLFLDEAYKGMDSYRSRSNANVLLSYFILQARHYGFRDLYYDAQDFRSVHRRVRINTDVGVRAWRIPIMLKGESVPTFKYMMRDFNDNSSTTFDMDYELAKEIWKYYDTHENVKAPSISLDPKLAKKMMKDIGKVELAAWSKELNAGDVDASLVRLQGGD